MSNIEINVKPNPYYVGTKSLDGNQYEFTIHWNTYTENWYLSLIGLNNDVDIRGMALLPGKDLLAPFGYYELGAMWMLDNSEADESPNFDDMGSQFTLEYVPLA